MPFFVIPSRRTRQPLGSVRLGGALGSRFSAGFVAGGAGVLTTFNSTLGPIGTGSMVLTGTGQGLALKSTAQDNRYAPLWPSANATTSPWEAPSTAVTVACFFKRTGAPTGDTPIFANYSPTTSPYYAWGLQEQVVVAGRLTFTVNYVSTSTQWTSYDGAINDGLPHVAVGTWDGTTALLYLDGRQVATSSPTSTITYPATARGPAVGNWWNYTGNRAFIGEVYGGAVAPVGISAAEAATLSRNPANFWGLLFSPEVRRIYFGAGGGTTTHDVSVAETTGAADTPTAISTRLAGNTETASAADSPAAVSTRLAGVTETGSAADTPNALRTRLAAVAETTSASDTPTAVSTRLAGVTETASAADTPDATTGATPGVVAETASATDTPTAVSTRLAATAETTSAAETPTAASTRLAAVAESASAAESADGTAVPAGASACTETASAADTVTCVIVTSGSIAEGTASATDVCAAGGIWADFVAETATAVATQYVIEPMSGESKGEYKLIDNEIVRLGSSPIDFSPARIGLSRPSPRKPRL